MTREEAICIIEKEIQIDVRCCTHEDACRFEDALRMAIAALWEQPQWISVEDEKPKSRGHYFIAYKFAGSDMRFYGEAFWHDDIPDNGYVQGDHFSNEGVDGMYVTHWMEIPKLPEPPKEEV